MKCFKTLLFLLIGMFSTFASAVEIPKTTHWFQFTVTYGDSSMQVTGSSRFDAEHMAARISGVEPIVLENLRECEIRPSGENQSFRWHTMPAMTRAFLVPRTVLFFFELKSDPLSQNQASDVVSQTK